MAGEDRTLETELRELERMPIGPSTERAASSIAVGPVVELTADEAALAGREIAEWERAVAALFTSGHTIAQSARMAGIEVGAASGFLRSERGKAYVASLYGEVGEWVRGTVVRALAVVTKALDSEDGRTQQWAADLIIKNLGKSAKLGIVDTDAAPKPALNATQLARELMRQATINVNIRTGGDAVAVSVEQPNADGTSDTVRDSGRQGGENRPLRLEGPIGDV